MSKLSIEKIIRDIAIVIAVSVAFTALLRFFFDFNLSQHQIILRHSLLQRFDRCAVVSPQGKKISGLILVGIPGDTVYIINSEPFVNSKNISSRFYTMFMIDLSGRGLLSVDRFPVSFTFMSFVDFNKLRQKLLIRPVSMPPMMYDSLTFPHNPHVPWNKDYFGKFIIPHKGLKLKLNKYTYWLYYPLIKEYEHAHIQVKDGKFYVRGRHTDYYTFDKDYFFFLNRNLYSQEDSRVWGPLPRSRVVGKIMQMPHWTRLIITKVNHADKLYTSLVSQIDFKKILP